MKNTIKPLEEILNYPQKIEQIPFRHIHVPNFFTDEFHQSLCQAFDELKNHGLSEPFRYDQLSRFRAYDAYYWLLPPASAHPLSFFYSPAWRMYFADLFEIPLTEDVVAEFHHHRVGSKDGFVHNDYNLCCFKASHLKNGTNPWYYQCFYDPSQNDMESGLILPRMRSIAIIYYLNDYEWLPGDGGETGLYFPDRDVRNAIRISPLPNTLLAFEVSPESYHGFLQNKRIERNTLIMWLHSDKEIKLARHNYVPPVSYGSGN